MNHYKEVVCEAAALAIFCCFSWLGVVLVLRYSLKLLLCYHGWMYEPRGKMSLVTRLWLVSCTAIPPRLTVDAYICGRGMAKFSDTGHI